MSEIRVEVYEKVVKYVVVTPEVGATELAIKVQEVSGAKVSLEGNILSLNVVEDLLKRGIVPQDLNLFNTLTTRDAAILSILVQPRAATNKAKEVLAATLQGVAGDIGNYLIGKNVSADVKSKGEGFKSWLKEQTNESRNTGDQLTGEGVQG